MLLLLNWQRPFLSFVCFICFIFFIWFICSICVICVICVICSRCAFVRSIAGGLRPRSDRGQHGVPLWKAVPHWCVRVCCWCPMLVVLVMQLWLPIQRWKHWFNSLGVFWFWVRRYFWYFDILIFWYFCFMLYEHVHTRYQHLFRCWFDAGTRWWWKNKTSTCCRTCWI